MNDDGVEKFHLNHLEIFGLFSSFDYAFDFSSNSNISILLGQNGSGKTTVFRLINAAFGGLPKFDRNLLFGDPVCQKIAFFLKGESTSIVVSYDYSTPDKSSFPLISISINGLQSEPAFHDEFISIQDLVNPFLTSQEIKPIAIDVDFVSASRLLNPESRDAFSSIFTTLVNFSCLSHKEKDRMQEIYHASSGGSILSADFESKAARVRNFFSPSSPPTDKIEQNQIDLSLMMLLSETSYGNPKDDILDLLSFGLSTSIANENCSKIFDWIRARFLSPEWGDVFKNFSRFRVAFGEARDRRRASHRPYQFINRTVSLQQDVSCFDSFVETTVSAPKFIAPSSELEKRIEVALRVFSSFQRLCDVFSKGFPNVVPLSLKYQPGEGIVVYREFDHVSFSLDGLSSGQLNALMVFYDILKPDVSLYKPKPSNLSLLLIDEPEISLHIDWQQTYLGHLEEAAQGKDLQIVVATQSPFILGFHQQDLVKVKETCLFKK